ncbi:MAG TPA: 3-dehydroquinate synthase [Mariprofundaceae bacterium]|nr:3-dehydroquinate synthase [Mariprofundaceae bacterium]
MSEQNYWVDLGPRSYNIHIEAGCLPDIGKAMSQLFGNAKRCMIVSNTKVAPLYLGKVEGSLVDAGWKVSNCVLPDGEQYKSLETWSRVMDALMDARLSRGEPIVALGGGVIGDMTGFAAACYRRGIPFVQVPTTLLAQVDSSVGGKTAINHPHGKNMIGAFYQPRLVWIDPRALQTLDIREVRAGMAEAIKYGLIRDAAFFDWFVDHIDDALGLDDVVLATLIHNSCRHKAEVVMRDEMEKGERALLNLGHTFGHAIEALTHYKGYLHGEAVALGTLMAARLSEQKGYAPDGTEARIRSCYEAVGLPVAVPKFPAEQWLDAMGHDKKNIGSHIRYILLHGIGKAFVAEEVQDEDIRQLIDSYR